MQSRTFQADEAREQLQMVSRILEHTHDGSNGCYYPYFIAWGLAGATFNFVSQAIFINGASTRLGWFAALVLVIAIAVSIRTSIQAGRAERRSIIGRQIGALFGISVGVALVTTFAAPSLFGMWTGAALWSVVMAIAMFFISTTGNRIAAGGAVALIASVIVANYQPHYAGYALAAGDLVGMFVPGLLYGAAQRRNG